MGQKIDYKRKNSMELGCAANNDTIVVVLMFNILQSTSSMQPPCWPSKATLHARVQCMPQPSQFSDPKLFGTCVDILKKLH